MGCRIHLAGCTWRWWQLIVIVRIMSRLLRYWTKVPLQEARSCTGVTTSAHTSRTRSRPTPPRPTSGGVGECEGIGLRYSNNTGCVIADLVVARKLKINTERYFSERTH